MPLNNEASLEDVKIRIRQITSNPSIREFTQVVLKEGPKAFRIATLMEIADSKNGEFHHHSLRIDQIDRKKDGWFQKPGRSITLNSKESSGPDKSSINEIEILYNFIDSHAKGRFTGKTGEYQLIQSEDYEKLSKLLELIPSIPDGDKIELVRRILNSLDANHVNDNNFETLFESVSPSTRTKVASSSRLVEYRKQLRDFESLVCKPNAKEHEIQELLSKNPWMFGSEYSELLDRRNWTRDEKLDFMLRCTVDGFLELIEIKLPITEQLFVFDDSHNCFYPSAKISYVVGQVIHYLEQIERHRDQIRSNDSEDPLKIKSKIIIGRDGTASQMKALRNYNAHLHRIEIITFDQLIRIAKRVLGVFGDDSADESQSVPVVEF